MSLELRGGQSPKNAEGVRGRSWKNSEMFLERKTGHPLTNTRGNRDEQRGLRDVMEIEWTLERKRYSGGRQSRNRLVGDLSVIDI